MRPWIEHWSEVAYSIATWCGIAAVGWWVAGWLGAVVVVGTLVLLLVY